MRILITVTILVPVVAWFIIAVNGDPIRSTRADGTKPCGVSFADYANSPQSAISGDYLWKDFIVVLDPAFSAQDRDIFQTSFNELADVLADCVNFQLLNPDDPTPDGDYVYVRKGSPGYCGLSNVGRTGGKQNMDIGCIDKDTIQHESIHALGFFHEQDRPDRDDFIDIHYENMDESDYSVYQKETDSLTYTPYDYISIMHYHANDFSNNGKPVLVAKNGELLGSQGSMTDYDKTKLKAHYKCQN